MTYILEEKKSMTSILEKIEVRLGERTSLFTLPFLNK